VREAVAAVFLVVLVASLRFLALTGFPDDHYVHLAGAQQMLHGAWPSRDFVDLGAPLTYSLSAAAQAIFGQGQLTEAVFMALAFALGAVLTLRAGVALTGSVALGLAGALIQVLIFPRTYSYPKMVLYAAAAVATLWYANAPSRTRIVVLAALIAIAGLVRHDHGAYVGIACLVAVALSPLPSDRFSGGASVAQLCGAVLVFILPYLIYLVTVDSIVLHLQRAAAFAALEVPRQRLDLADMSLSDTWLLGLVWLTPVMAVGLLASGTWRGATPWTMAQRVMPLVVLALVADLALIRDRLEVRLPDAIVAPSLLLVWLAARAWRRMPRTASITARILSVGALIMTLWSASSMGAFVEQLDRAGVFAGLGRIPERFSERTAEMERPWIGRQTPSAVAREMRPFFDYAERCIPPDQRLLVPGFIPEIVVLARRPFAGGQVWFMAGALNTRDDHARVLSRLAGEQVRIAIVRRPTYDDLAREFPELDAYITGNFTETAKWSLGGDDTIALLMNASAATRMDSATGWPCFT
jgi:hypothetical protein